MPFSKPGYTLITAAALAVALPVSSYAQNPFEGAIQQTEQDPSAAATDSDIVVVTPDPAVPGINRNAPGFSERDCPYQSGTGNRGIVDSQAASLTDDVDCTAGNNDRESSQFGFSGLSGNRNQTVGANNAGSGGSGGRSGAIGDSDLSGVITTGAGSQGVGASGIGSEGSGSSGLGSEGSGSTGLGAEGAGAGG